MYNTILIGFDGSDYSKAALKEASGWLKMHGGKAILVHGVYFDEEEFGIAPVQLEKRLEHGTKLCYQARETASSEFGIEIESIVCQGEPPDVILDIAREKGADLIALGTHGRKGLKRLILGSVTSQVILDSHCDVMVVKRKCGDCAGRYRSILVLFDGSQFSRDALERACRLSALDNAEITVLYVIPRYEEMIGFFKTDSIRRSLMDGARKILHAAEEIASFSGVRLKTLTEDGHAAEKAVETAARLQNDLIVMGSHGWRGVNKAIMGGTAERVIISAPCPVLVAR